MADIRSYDSRIVEISKSILLDVFALLKEYKNNLVLVGGWVPYFLLGRYKTEDTKFQHIGSIDIDIAIDHKKIPGLDEVYESIRRKLERNGYSIRKSKDGQFIPYSFEKGVEGTVIHVDFLASKYGGTGNRHRHQRVQDIFAIKARGVDIAFQNNEEFEIKGTLPDRARHKIEAKVSGTVSLITMKAIAFGSDITRTKDAYDIYSILKYYKKGVKSVITEMKPFLQNRLVAEAKENLSSLFASIESVGPVGLSNFLLPEGIGSDDWEFYKRDAFELVQELLEGLK